MIEPNLLELKNELHIELLKAAKEARSLGYNPTQFNRMLLEEGGYVVAKKLIVKTSSGFNNLWELNRLDLSTEAIILREKFRPLFTIEELELAKNRLHEFNYEIDNKKTNLPPLQPSGRIREFNSYSDILKANIIFEHIVNGLQHRELDEVVLGLNSQNSKGFQSMGILHFLGIRADYKGLFEGKELQEVIGILSEQGKDYEEPMRLLSLLDNTALVNAINDDIEAEQVEEGRGIEGAVQYYYGKRYERDLNNRKLAIKKHGLDCYVCGFNFEDTYGDRGKDFIEVHHIQPLSTLEEAMEINPETDLVPLCANCHRMVHRKKDNVLSVEELKQIVKKSL